MRLSTRQVTLGSEVWLTLPPGWRSAAVAVLAALAARAAGGSHEPGPVPDERAAAAEDPPGAPQEAPMTTDDLTTALRPLPTRSTHRTTHRQRHVPAPRRLPRQFIHHGTRDGNLIAAIDWDAAITALNAGELPLLPRDRQSRLRSASHSGR